MAITIVIMLLVGAASAVFRRSFDFWASPVTWTRTWSFVVIALYTLLGAATGLLGWWFGTWAHWHPESDWVRGLAWGAFGAAVARTGFGAVPAEGGSDAISLLSAGAAFILGGLRWGSGRATRLYLNSLDQPGFIRFASEVMEQGAQKDERLSSDLHTVDLLQMRDLVTAIEAGDEESARGRLTAKVVRWIYEYNIPRPATGK